MVNRYLINFLLIGSFRFNYPIKFRCVRFDHHFTFSYLNKPKCVGTQNKTSLPADIKIFVNN